MQEKRIEKGISSIQSWRFMKIKNELREILEKIQLAGGQGLVVGGSVRDYLIDPNIEPKDLDVEVYRLPVDELVELLQGYGKVDQVGKSFGVIKLTTKQTDYDFSLPRTENKEGKGHTGFMVEVDPNISPRQAARRRDFTINSIAYDPLAEEFIDHFGGMLDLKCGLLEPTSEAFSEDPLRVLRGFQFAARFNLIGRWETHDLCESLLDEYKDLSKERVWGEWYKWATKSVNPSMGLEFLDHCGWLTLYPELEALKDVEQDSEYHPEGDVFIHTQHVVDAAARICARENITGYRRAVVVFAALCHDLGKPSCTDFIDGRWRSRGHEQSGAEPTRSFLDSIGCPKAIADQVIPLVERHLAHLSCESSRSVRRLAGAIAPATIEDLVLVIEADHSGRPPLEAKLPERAARLLELAKKNNCNESVIKPILLGRHLIGKVQPGKEYKGILSRAFEAQLDGEFVCLRGAVEWLEANYEFGDKLINVEEE